MEKWRVTHSRVVLERAPWLRVHEERVVLPTGRIIEDYVLTEQPEVVMAFALTEDRLVLFVEQYKHGVGDLMWALPAGYLDASDLSALEACRRELAEETGYRATDWQPLGAYVLDPNRWHNRIHFFLARGARLLGGQRLDPTEAIQVHLVPLTDVPALIGTRILEVGSAAGVLLALARLGGR